MRPMMGSRRRRTPSLLYRGPQGRHGQGEDYTTGHLDGTGAARGDGVQRGLRPLCCPRSAVVVDFGLNANPPAHSVAHRRYGRIRSFHRLSDWQNRSTESKELSAQMVGPVRPRPLEELWEGRRAVCRTPYREMVWKENMGLSAYSDGLWGIFGVSAPRVLEIC